ncbi:MAG: MFS transporter [Jatrophihabitans sp.]
MTVAADSKATLPLRFPGFRKLFVIRLAGQFGDGVFQASLAGAVLFNPERQTHAADVAAGFAVVLLPYSFVGPFAGVFIDRWHRQRTLLFANLIRAVLVIGLAVEVIAGLNGVAFYASALVVISVNRFVLSALSAGLPHVVDASALVGSNALSTTSGGIAATIGGAAAIGVRAIFDPSGGNVGYGVIAIFAALPYALAGLAATRFAKKALGPDATAVAARETALEVYRGLVAGAQHIRSRRPVALALAAIGLHRFCYGITTVSTLLLYRNYFRDDGILRAGLPGVGQAVVGIGIGAGLAAVATPTITRRIGLVRYPGILLLIASVTQITLGLPFKMLPLLTAAVILGYVAQAVKISVDTVVQGGVDDEFRGRVFSLYDTMFNITFVSAAVVTALLLPDTGKSAVAVVLIGVGYAVIGIGYLTRRNSELSGLRTDLPAAPMQ